MVIYDKANTLKLNNKSTVKRSYILCQENVYMIIEIK